MAVPSAVTLGSVAFVVAAGVGLVAVSSSASEDPSPRQTSVETPTVVPTPTPDPPSTTKPPKRDPVDVVPKSLVDVYNNSGISGLAADKAAFLEGAGWSVAGSDNWYGNIPENTVYYPARLKSQAQQLARVLGIGRLRPAVSPMKFDHLTVIFTAAS